MRSLEWSERIGSWWSRVRYLTRLMVQLFSMILELFEVEFKICLLLCTCINEIFKMIIADRRLMIKGQAFDQINVWVAFRSFSTHPDLELWSVCTNRLVGARYTKWMKWICKMISRCQGSSRINCSAYFFDFGGHPMLKYQSVFPCGLVSRWST